MSRQSDLHLFTRTALSQGHGPEEIAAALAAAGWSADEVAGALGAWDLRPGLPPVPRRERAALSAGMALVEGLHLIALGMVATQLVQLLITLVDIWLPEEQRQLVWRMAELRWLVAALVVFVPLWLWSGARTRPAAGQRRAALSVWIGHLAVFLAAIALLGDALAIVYRFLQGDMTLGFVLKALLVAAVAALVILAMQERRHD
ncbi:MAG: hypothetical protein IT542_01085 [Rubellimicrobium sp.]|nr:hypothetical protein [Rubellimicrobium sp.]